MTGLLFDKLKCTHCKHLSSQAHKCPNCQSLYCKDCLVFQSKGGFSFNMIGNFYPTCLKCHFAFRDFRYYFTDFDHFKIKAQPPDEN